MCESGTYHFCFSSANQDSVSQPSKTADWEMWSSSFPKKKRGKGFDEQRVVSATFSIISTESF